MSRLKTPQIFKQKLLNHICKVCGKKLKKEWYISNDEFFCSIAHADSYENKTQEVKNGDI